jgi:hypothetical protein
MSLAFAVATGLAVAVLATKGTQPKGIVTALKVTARWSFFMFWLAYVSGSLSALFGVVLAPLGGRGRDFGLAYAAAQLVHVGLVIWLFQISVKAPLTGRLFDFFVLGIAWTYLLAFLSFGTLAEQLGPVVWQILRTAGMNYILLAFAVDFVTPFFHAAAHDAFELLVQYAPFAAMCIAAPLLVLTAKVRGRPRPGSGAREIRSRWLKIGAPRVPLGPAKAIARNDKVHTILVATRLW